ncbi:hypothetical protein WJX72_011840 [[Myrmecia] bisecta]|uniref:Uncharacterized protein n=1 Tax=[Myrmecia] bisecta TaxID=41462 RepID=A0AAW1PBA1_9CHLO
MLQLQKPAAGPPPAFGSPLPPSDPYANPYVGTGAGQDPYTGSYAEPAPGPLGAKVERWLKTPFDILAFGPRVTLGALASLPELAQNLQFEVEKANMLVQDPRPISEKQAQVAQELETAVSEFVEKGAGLEADLLAQLSAVLPPQVEQMLPPEVKEAMYRKAAAADVPLEPINVYEDPTPMSATTLAVNQTAAEMTNLRGAVADMREALTQLRVNTDPSKVSIYRLNVRDARDGLARRLSQLSTSPPTPQDASVAAAIDEATILLADVDSLQL